MQQIFSVILLLACITIIVAVLMKESKSQGIASLTGETNIAGKGGRKTKDNYLNQIVVVASVIFFIAAIGLAVIQ